MKQDENQGHFKPSYVPGSALCGHREDDKESNIQKQAFLLFHFLWDEGQGRACQGKVLVGEWEQSFSFVTYMYCIKYMLLKFSSRYSKGLPSYGLQQP